MLRCWPRWQRVVLRCCCCVPPSGLRVPPVQLPPQAQQHPIDGSQHVLTPVSAGTTPQTCAWGWGSCRAAAQADHQHRIFIHAPAGCGTWSSQVGGAGVSYLVDPAPRPAAPAAGRPLRPNTAIASPAGPLLDHARRCAWFPAPKISYGCNDGFGIDRSATRAAENSWFHTSGSCSFCLLQLPTAASNVRSESKGCCASLVVRTSMI